MSLYSEILADSPRLYYRLSSQPSPPQVIDSSGNGLHATAIDAPSFGPPALYPIGGASVLFSPGKYITRASNATLNVGDTFSVEAWIQLSPGGFGTQGIFSKQIGASAYLVLYMAGDRLSLALSPTGVVATSTVTLDGSSHHVVATKSGSTVKLYVDGIDRTGTVTNQTFYNGTFPATVGAMTSNGGGFGGRIQDVAFYGVALSSARVAAHYAARFPTPGAAALAAAGSVSANSIRRQRSGSTLTGAGVLSPTSVARRRTGVALSALGVIHVTADVILSPTAHVIMAGSGSLVSTGLRRGIGAVVLSAAGQATVAGRRKSYTGATLAGSGAFSPAGLRRGLGAAELHALGTLAAASRRKSHASAALVAAGTLVPHGVGRFVGSVALLGVGDLRATPEAPRPPMPEDPPTELITEFQVSDRFLAVLRESHQMAVVVQVLSGVTGEVLRELDTVKDGSVTLDGSAAIRGRCDLEIVDDGTLDLIPVLPTDPLAPYGNELRIARGVRYLDRTAEAVSLGVFRIRSVEPTEEQGGGLSVRVSGLDRWSRFVDSRFESTYSIPAGTNYMTAIIQTAQQAWPDVPYVLPATTRTTPTLVQERGEDRGAFLQAMATSLGLELYFDGTGILRGAPIAAGTGQAEWEIAEGDGGVLLSAAKQWDSERVYNRVIASGEPMDDRPAVCGVATDDNPSSPTYYHGPFGRRPRFYVSSMITTAQQAVDAASGILAAAIGTSQQVRFGALVNPALRPNSTVRIKRARLGLDETHVLDSVTIPLAAGESMTGQSRVTEVLGE